MDIKSRNTEKKLKQQISRLNDFLSFLSNIYRINKTYLVVYLRNPGRDFSFPIFTRKEIEIKKIRKEIKTIISRFTTSYISSIFSRKEIETRILERKSKQKNISFYRLNISFIQHDAGLQLVDFLTNWRPGTY